MVCTQTASQTRVTLKKALFLVVFSRQVSKESTTVVIWKVFDFTACDSNDEFILEGICSFVSDFMDYWVVILDVYIQLLQFRFCRNCLWEEVKSSEFGRASDLQSECALMPAVFTHTRNLFQ